MNIRNFVIGVTSVIISMTIALTTDNFYLLFIAIILFIFGMSRFANLTK